MIDRWQARQLPFLLRRLYVKHAAEVTEKLRQEPEKPLVIRTEVGPVLVKSGIYPPPKHTPALGFVGDSLKFITKPVGGLHPLAATLLGSAMGAGLGYAGGAAYGWLGGPYVDKQRAKKTGLIAGALGGAALPAALYAYPAMKIHGWRGLLKEGQWPQYSTVGMPVPFTMQTPMTHHAMSVAGAHAPTIPVDRFNRLVLEDPFTPPETQAAITGLVAATAIANGDVGYVSPFDVGRMAMRVGAGLGSGMLVGRTLGAVAALSPKAQTGVSKLGLLAGILNAVAGKVFQ